jgi:hypothetical protein
MRRLNVLNGVENLKEKCSCANLNRIKEINLLFPELINGASSVPRRDSNLTGQAKIPTESVCLKMAV